MPKRPQSWEEILVYLLIGFVFLMVVTLALLALPARGQVTVDLPLMGGGR